MNIREKGKFNVSEAFFVLPTDLAEHFFFYKWFELQNIRYRFLKFWFHPLSNNAEMDPNNVGAFFNYVIGKKFPWWKVLLVLSFANSHGQNLVLQGLTFVNGKVKKFDV